MRVERLQAISEPDARAEGAAYADWVSGRECLDPRVVSHRDGFRIIWESINGAESWEANPWVWALTFRRVEAT